MAGTGEIGCARLGRRGFKEQSVQFQLADAGGTEGRE